MSEPELTTGGMRLHGIPMFLLGDDPEICPTRLTSVGSSCTTGSHGAASRSPAEGALRWRPHHLGRPA